ncbi:hypothetical protein CHS0354_011298 [Potamilus streckersoni]|uniref:RUN domain-containing protein n=1 Tax=Potamilus streckersoni TaxID=2493646 RepID=A0AAE0S8Z5_9BIVA|nr:hypothetical protein CHS0354_011298 [Potamilus streckersoni]
MSLFKRRGPKDNEIARENEIKRNITQELSKAVKALQKDNVAKADPVYSSDVANAVCSALEAVFLHGLKSSVTRKNFWQFVSKFTHADVVAQLKHLGQITTEIGLCRAWIRMALNDCLMESYVDAVISDKDSLQYHYSRLSYLRDLEQPEILKTYLKGLMEFEFKLSYNSSVLNSWGTTPLILAGFIVPDDCPPAVIKPAVSSTVPSIYYDDPSVNHIGSSDIVFPTRKSHPREKSSLTKNNRAPRAVTEDVDNPMARPAIGASSDTSYIVSQSHFTREDVETFKTLSCRKNYFLGNSECSSSSPVSCPDFPEHNMSPSNYIDEPVKKKAPERSQSLVSSQSDLLIIPEMDKDMEDKLLFNSLNNTEISESVKDSQLQFSEDGSLCKNVQELQETQQLDEPDSSLPPNISIRTDQASEDKTREPFKEKTISIGNMTEKSQMGNKVGANTDIKSYSLEDVPKREKLLGKKHRLKPDLSPPKREPLKPELSISVAVNLDRITDRFSRPRLSLPTASLSYMASSIPNTNERKKNEDDLNSSVQDIMNEKEAEVDIDYASEEGNQDGDFEYIVNDERRQSLGNSLGAYRGWSSSFETSAEDPFDNTQEPVSSRSKAASFRTMLNNYTPSSALTTASVKDVIDSLPRPNIIHSATTESDRDKENLEDLTDDFEVVSAFTASLSVDKPDSAMNSWMPILGQMCNEKGLDAQNYQCLGCKRPVGLIYGNPRVCSYDGGYYCFECHENDEAHIPAYIVHNWDFRKHSVSKQNLQFLKEFEDQPLLNIETINPRLYEHVQEMEEIRLLRLQLFSLKTYLFTCRQSVAEDLRKFIWPKDYLYEDIHLYSISDLLQVPTGALAASLKKIIKFATKHVYACLLCNQKGFICELCNNPKVIYPFELEATYRCPKCKSVFHKECKTDNRPCPKCQRRMQRQARLGQEPDTPDCDYAYVPY